MSFPERTSGYIEDGIYYEVPLQSDSVYIAGPPIEAIPVSRPAPPSPPVPPARPPAWPKLLLAALSLLVVFAIAALVFIALRPAGSSGSVNSTAQISACRERVKAQLKAPATAQFSGEAVTKQPTGSFWEVSGVVDAQNGFGALIRNRYRCTVTGEGEALAVTLSDWS